MRTIRFLLLLGLLASAAKAQWATQTLPLHAGWNAVYLEIQPEPRECDAVFASLSIERAWGWNRRFSPVQYIKDPTELLPSQPDWLMWVPVQHPLSKDINLFALEGGKCYLLKLPDNASPTNMVIQGRPLVRKIEWLSDSFNLVGFSLDTEAPPTFGQFFGASRAHSKGPVFRLDSNGTWVDAGSLDTARMRSGEAFWVRCEGSSTYQGPLSVEVTMGRGLDYGRALVEQSLVVRNSSAVSNAVTLSRLASAPPPSDPGYPALAGEVPLYFWQFEQTNAVNWHALPAQWVTDVAPASAWTLRLEARRAEMAAFIPPTGVTEFLYQNLLQVKGGGVRLLVPVTAQGLQSYQPAAAALQGQAPEPPADNLSLKHTGLWIGSASIKEVSQPIGHDPSKPLPTASDFQFRLMVHVDGNGRVRLLQKILQMWLAGTTKPDPTDPSKNIVDQPGRFVLLTDDRLIPNYAGATLRDGRAAARRFSSAVFGFKEPLVMTNEAGAFGEAGGQFSCPVVLSYDDPLNPFKHRYHPEHDNLDDRFGAKLPEGRESFTVTREVSLEFSAKDPEGIDTPGWGDTRIGGLYREKISGLHKDALHIQGVFNLHHASRLEVLNDGQ